MCTRPDFGARFVRAVLFVLAGAGAASGPASAATVENVDWPTYYPSPYGNYRRLNTTGNTTMGTQANSTIVLAAGGGRVGIGSSAPAQFFDVQSPAGVASATMSAAFVNTNNAGIQVGGFKNAGGAVQQLGGVQSIGGALVLNPGGANVSMGNTAASAADLTIRGGIAFDRGGNRGPYRVAEHTDGNYYAVYAPG